MTLWLRLPTGHEHAFLAAHAIRSACGVVVAARQAGSYPTTAETGPVRAEERRSPCSHCRAAIRRLRRLHEEGGSR